MHPMKRGLRIIGIFRPAVPLMMIGIGWLIPVLGSPVTMPTTNGLWLALVISGGVVFVWLLAEIITVVDRNTKVFHLQWDDFSSLAIALVLTEWHGRLVNAGSLEWWFILPWLGAIIDGILSGFLAINNAAQKPIAQVGRG